MKLLLPFCRRLRADCGHNSDLPQRMAYLGSARRDRTAHFRRPYSLPLASRPLAISGNGNAGVYGGWEYDVTGIQANSWYRFTAYYRSIGVHHESLAIVPRVDWKTADNQRAGRPDYPYQLCVRAIGIK